MTSVRELGVCHSLRFLVGTGDMAVSVRLLGVVLELVDNGRNELRWMSKTVPPLSKNYVST